MKLDPMKLILGLLGVILSVVGFVAATVWDGVQIAEANEVHLEHVREAQRELRLAQKEIRSDLDRLWAASSDLAKEVQ